MGKIDIIDEKAVISGEFTHETAALNWVKQYVNTDKSELIKDNPWAKTYKISHDDGTAYLKVLPASLSGAIMQAQSLSEALTDRVPHVLATNEALRLILMADHKGQNFSKSPNSKQRAQILSRYAQLQIQAAQKANLLKCFPKLDIDTLVDELIVFFDCDAARTNNSPGRVSADEFLSKSRCRQYKDLLSRRSDLLKQYGAVLAEAPQTLNHCDLRYKNIAHHQDESLTIYDWDEARTGPAGLSLHAMFSGCSHIVSILDGKPLDQNPEKFRRVRAEITRYIRALSKGEFAEESLLEKTIGPAAVYGMINYITSFGLFPKDSDKYRKTVAGNIKKRMSDLLDVCDILTALSPNTAVAMAKDYIDHDRPERAEWVLFQAKSQAPDNPRIRFELGRLYRRRQKLRRAVKELKQGVDIAPTNASLRSEYGKSLAQSGEFDKAISQLRRAQNLNPKDRIQSYLKRLQELSRMQADAVKIGHLPAVRFSEKERRKGKIDLETLCLCNALFRKYGVLKLENVFDTDVLNTCHETFLERYKDYLKNKKHKDALRIGDKRFQVTIDFEAPYNNPNLYGNPLVLPLMQQLLGKEFTFGCFTSSMSLPGSEDQRIHKDLKALFHDDPDAGTIPSFAVTMMVPLIDIDETVGTTRVKKGTHRLTTRQSKDFPFQTPILSVGDCYLMDYRLTHNGQANTSERARPILSLVYQRPWFRDNMNFKNQPSIRIKKENFENMPSELKKLLSWSQEPSPLQ